MQTITMIELKLEEARSACETAQDKLHQRGLAHWLLPNDFYYFAGELEYQMELLDEVLGLIAISQTPLNRIEALSQTLLKDGLQAPTFSLFQTGSDQAMTARELANIWYDDELRMVEIERILIEFNHSVRDMQRERNHPAAKWMLNLFGFPTTASLPQTVNLRLVKDLFEPGFQQSTGHPIIEVPTQRLARNNLHKRDS